MLIIKKWSILFLLHQFKETTQRISFSSLPSTFLPEETPTSTHALTKPYPNLILLTQKSSTIQHRGSNYCILYSISKWGRIHENADESSNNNILIPNNSFISCMPVVLSSKVVSTWIFHQHCSTVKTMQQVLQVWWAYLDWILGMQLLLHTISADFSEITKSWVPNNHQNFLMWLRRTSKYCRFFNYLLKLPQGFLFYSCIM